MPARRPPRLRRALANLQNPFFVAATAGDPAATCLRLGAVPAPFTPAADHQGSADAAGDGRLIPHRTFCLSESPTSFLGQTLIGSGVGAVNNGRKSEGRMGETVPANILHFKEVRRRVVESEHLVAGWRGLISECRQTVVT
jgi:hypothetical protein